MAQLNRENEKRLDKRPTLSDLRATGAMEEDADGVIFVHRPDYYDPDYKRGQAEPERTELSWRKTGMAGQAGSTCRSGRRRIHSSPHGWNRGGCDT